MTKLHHWLSVISFRMVLGMLLIYMSPQIQAACTFFDDFKDNNDGTVTDTRNGLIWKRCAEGFEWNGSRCHGRKMKMDWFAAMQAAQKSQFLGKADWRIPSKTEFESVLGSYEECKKNDSRVGQYAASTSIAHGVEPYNDLRSSNDLPGNFWSATPVAGNVEAAVYGDFLTGLVGPGYRDMNNYVRLVRSSQSPNRAAESSFKTEAAKATLYKKEVDAIARKKADTQREYESSSAGVAARQSRQMCEAQKQTCFANCGPATFWDGRAYVESRTYLGCTSRCEGIRCN